MNRIYLWLNELYWKLRRQPERSIRHQQFLLFLEQSQEHMLTMGPGKSGLTLDDFTGLGKTYFSGNPRAFISDEEE